MMNTGLLYGIITIVLLCVIIESLNAKVHQAKTQKQTEPTETNTSSKDELLNSKLYLITDQHLNEAVQAVMDEWGAAVKQYPFWPVSAYTGLAIIGEEAGEAIKATLDAEFKGAPIKDAIKEHAQASAMHIRQIQHLMSVEGVNNV